MDSHWIFIDNSFHVATNGKIGRHYWTQTGLFVWISNHGYFSNRCWIFTKCRNPNYCKNHSRIWCRNDSRNIYGNEHFCISSKSKRANNWDACKCCWCWSCCRPSNWRINIRNFRMAISFLGYRNTSLFRIPSCFNNP